MSNNKEPQKSPRPGLMRGYWRRMGGKFLVLSILAHLLLVIGAAFYVVQRIQPKKIVFKAGAPVTNPAKQAQEHKVQMAKKRKSMSAPAPAKRVMTAVPAKIVLPDLPAMPANTFAPTQITGLGGVGTAFGGMGNGSGGGDGGAGNFMSPFGGHDAHGGALVGTYYDFKFTRDGKDAKNVDKAYADDITRFVKAGWHEGILDKYLQGPRQLYATEIFFPTIESADAPTAFGSPKPGAEGKWIVVYKGYVSPPESGTYYFVGAGDDDLIIRFNGKLVLFNCEHIDAPEGNLTNFRGTKAYGTALYRYEGEVLSYAKGMPMDVEAGKDYLLEILIGDDVPSKTFAKILIEKKGMDYRKDGGSPVLPIFALDKVMASGTEPPAHTSDGPLWKGKGITTSLLNTLSDSQ